MFGAGPGIAGRTGSWLLLRAQANLIQDGTAVPSGTWLLVPDEKG